jgi:creatinine amidohydrolase/Fe(II)-dependent formamide hydrolase-like protein
MAGEILHYEELTASRLADLDRENTLVLMAIGPLEVHGPHLPLGTDVLVAIELQKRIIAQARERRPDTNFLILPPAFVGSDSLPAPGSVDVGSRAIHHLLRATARSLAAQGFRILLVTDNHGGPRHQVAIEKAVRRVFRSSGFALIAPFNRLYRRMIEGDPRLLDDTGAAAGCNGDDADNHAGTNETSLMLTVAPGLISPSWKTLGLSSVPEQALTKRLFGILSGAVERLGARRLARDLVHLGATLGWVNMEPMPTYIGDPSLADAGAGERMLQAHVAEAVTMLEEVWAGKPPFSEPLLWDLRFIERSW